MQRDVIYFVGGIPDELLIRDKHFLIAPVDPSFRPVIGRLSGRTTRWLSSGTN